MWNPHCVYETWKWYIVKHNCVPKGVFSDYNGQLHVSACTGHLQVVLGELKILLQARYAYSNILSSPKTT